MADSPQAHTAGAVTVTRGKGLVSASAKPVPVNQDTTSPKAGFQGPNPNAPSLGPDAPNAAGRPSQSAGATETAAGDQNQKTPDGATERTEDDRPDRFSKGAWRRVLEHEGDLDLDSIEGSGVEKDGVKNVLVSDVEAAIAKAEGGE